MRQQMLTGVTSVGLSALLVGLLLVAPRPDQPVEPEASIRIRARDAAPPPVNMRPPTNAPVEVVLPNPPQPAKPNKMKHASKSNAEAVKPLAIANIKPVSPMVPLQPSVKQPSPAVAVRPSLPSSVAPKFDGTGRLVKNVLAPPFGVSQKKVTTENAVAIIRTSEDAELAEQGRVLLRMLEHGNGPTIELAWPDRAAERERLYRTFRECLGMRLALLDVEGHLYIGTSPPGHAWQPNVDRYSGFARKPNGQLATAERRDILTISRHHSLPRAVGAIRIFPRRIDAQMLGGLHRLVGDGYGEARNIRANYQLLPDGVAVMDIRVDGQPLAGSVALATPVKSGCRGG